jgi:hypothetical protein
MTERTKIILKALAERGLSFSKTTAQLSAANIRSVKKYISNATNHP